MELLCRQQVACTAALILALTLADASAQENGFGMALGNGGYAFGGTLDENGLNGVAAGPDGTKKIRGGKVEGEASPFAIEKKETGMGDTQKTRRTRVAPGITLTQDGSGLAGIELNLGHGGPAAIGWGNAPADGKEKSNSAFSIDVGGLQLQFSEDGLRAQRSASDAFRAADYDAALQHLTGAIRGLPESSDLGQLESLVHFARNDYRQAADAAYRALAAGRGWQWDALRRLYDDRQDYTEQLRALERATADDPDTVENHFLLAYHYIMLGHHETAERHLAQAGKLLPQDTLIDDLLEMVRSQGADDTPPPPPAADR